MKYLTISGLKKFQMPIVGFGTPSSKEVDVRDVLLTALNCGYRHIDTAYMYENEEFIGSAIKKWINDGKGNREDLFITTKLPVFGNRPKDVEKYLKLSLDRLQLDYVDLYLIDSPFSIVSGEGNIVSILKNEGSYYFDNNNKNIDTWQVMEKQVRNGLAKAVGLSNFNAAQIAMIYENSEIKPAVLEIEMHAYLQQKELIQFCKIRNIVITAYSPLGRPGSSPPFVAKCILDKTLPIQLHHPIVNELASKYNKTPAQILLRHLVQQEIAVIPRSTNLQRMKENLELFEFQLSVEDMIKIGELDQGENGRSIDFRFIKGAEQHPEYPFHRAS